jgi:glycine/D-amino acid oxidase-like deaminating enzyme/nitrite reductase/ring-hydroxylating ferredoxin subunit
MAENASRSVIATMLTCYDVSSARKVALACTLPLSTAPSTRRGTVQPQSGWTRSLWHATIGEMTREPLAQDARADVCVVGAGIAGMVSAYLLAREGRRVIVVDDGPIGGGETGRTTAHLSDALDDRYVELERLHGEDGARLAAASHRAAIERLARIVEEERIDCGFTWVDGYLFPTEESDLTEEMEAALRAGVDVAWADTPPYAPFGTGRALKFARQGRFHPLRFIEGLARCIERDGGRIHTGTHVKGVHGGSPVRVETDSGATIRASACIVATNSPISDYVVTHLKQAPYRTFALAARVPQGSVPDALYWNDADPYIYIRIESQADQDWVIVGGEDYKTGQKEDDAARLQRLEAWARERFPIQSVEHAWSGQVLEPADGMAYIGPNPDGAENIYIVTGDSGHGMTHGTIGGLLLTDMIAGRRNDWTTLYDPRRVTLGAAGSMAKENLNVAAQYAAWVLPGDTPDVADIPPGEGRVVRRGSHMVAAFRDEHGTLHERNAACTHLKCVVNWNALEKSWDCPCHGSRFGPTGDVLNGPALSSLEEL